MFKRDDTREILIFPTSIPPEHRRSIHILAHNMGLEHQSIGEADARQITVLKRQQPSPTANVQKAAIAHSLDMHKRGLSRAATFDFAADRDSRAANSNYAHVMGRQGPTLELPGSPDGSGIPNNLRAAKSFADLRSFTPSPSQASSSYLAPGAGVSSIGPGSTARFGDYHGHVQPGSSGTPGSKGDNGLVSSLGSLSLGPFDPNAMQGQARNAPGAIGSQRPGASSNSKSVPERQPRGPEWESSAGFGGRVGPNGHAQRGSGMPPTSRQRGNLLANFSNSRFLRRRRPRGPELHWGLAVPLSHAWDVCASHANITYLRAPLGPCSRQPKNLVPRGR